MLPICLSKGWKPWGMKNCFCLIWYVYVVFGPLQKSIYIKVMWLYLLGMLCFPFWWVRNYSPFTIRGCTFACKGARVELLTWIWEYVCSLDSLGRSRPIQHKKMNEGRGMICLNGAFEFTRKCKCWYLQPFERSCRTQWTFIMNIETQTFGVGRLDLGA